MNVYVKFDYERLPNGKVSVGLLWKSDNNNKKNNVRIDCGQGRLSLSTDGDKCAMVNFLVVGGMNKKLLKHVFALYSLPIIFSKKFLPRYALSIAFLSSTYKCKHAISDLQHYPF